MDLEPSFDSADEVRTCALGTRSRVHVAEHGCQVRARLLHRTTLHGRHPATLDEVEEMDGVGRWTSLDPEVNGSSGNSNLLREADLGAPEPTQRAFEFGSCHDGSSSFRMRRRRRSLPSTLRECEFVRCFDRTPCGRNGNISYSRSPIGVSFSIHERFQIGRVHMGFKYDPEADRLEAEGSVGEESEFPSVVRRRTVVVETKGRRTAGSAGAAPITSSALTSIEVVQKIRREKRPADAIERRAPPKIASPPPRLPFAKK
jgi:hypothetical protein